MKNSPKSIEDFKTAIAEARQFREKSGRPYITISYAQSLDGSIATLNKKQMQLSGRESMLLTHQLRACCQSILVGIGTVLADNPSLTVRLVEGQNPQPIILDTHLRTPQDAMLVRRSDLSTWIVNGNHDGVHPDHALRKNGATLIGCRCDADGLIDLVALMNELARRNIDSVMVEGGARVITSFIKLGLADLFVITLAPRLVGGLSVIDTENFKAASYIQLKDVHYQRLGVDLIIWARPNWSD